MYHAHVCIIVLFFINKMAGIYRTSGYVPDYDSWISWIHWTVWTDGVKRLSRFIKNLHCNVMNKLYINIFQRFRNIFHIKFYHPVIGSLIMLFLIWLLVIIVLAGPVRPASWQTTCSEEKVCWYVKKLFKNRQQFYIGDGY